MVSLAAALRVATAAVLCAGAAGACTQCADVSALVSASPDAFRIECEECVEGGFKCGVRGFTCEKTDVVVAAPAGSPLDAGHSGAHVDGSHAGDPGHDVHGAGHGDGHEAHGVLNFCYCPNITSLPVSPPLSCSYNDKYETCEVFSPCVHEHEHEPPYVIFFIFCTFFIGCMVRKLFSQPPFNVLPFTIVMFLLGGVIGLIVKTAGEEYRKYITIANIDPHLIFYVFLPILIFESAFSLEWFIFRKALLYCLVLAGPGIIFATGLTAVLVRLSFTTAGLGTYNWSWITCVLYGAIVSATDPVAVVALLKELGAPATISALIEGESLMNDGTAIVLFNILKASVPSGEFTLSPGETLWELIQVAGGGPLLGLAMGIFGQWCLSKVFNDALIEITITLFCAYITFFIAEGFLHVSGVLALVVLGVWLSHHRQAISPEVEHALHDFWQTTVFLANALIFMIVGLHVASPKFSGITGTDVAYLFLAYGIITVVRLVLVFAAYYPLSAFSQRKVGFSLDVRSSVLVWWGGLRGAVGLALTLLVEGDTAISCVHGDLGTKFLFHCVGLCSLTLLVNGISAQFLVAKTGLAEIPAGQKQLLSRCFEIVLQHQRDSVRELKVNPVLSDVNWQAVHRLTHEEMKNPYAVAPEEAEKINIEKEAHHAYMKLIRASIWEQYEAGFIEGATVLRTLKFIENINRGKYQLIMPDVLNKYWEESYLASKMGGFSLSMPQCGGTLARMSTTWKEKRWAAGFEVATCIITAHEDCYDRINALITDIKVANRIKGHCKFLRAGCMTHVMDLTTERTPIAVAIQTRHAARRVLNNAKTKINEMVHKGILERSESEGLEKIIDKKMEKLQKSHLYLAQTDQTEVLQDEVPWMSRLEYGAVSDFNNHGTVYTPRKRSRILTRENATSGFYIIVHGVARIRFGSGRSLLLGTGDCIGICNLLCDRPIIVEGYAETDMKLLWYTRDVIVSLKRKYATLDRVLWGAGSIEAAFLILHVRRPYNDWSSLKLRKFCETGVAFIGESGSDAVSAGMHHILVDGSVSINEKTYTGLQMLPIKGSLAERVVCDASTRLFRINDPTSREAAARQRWQKIRNKLLGISVGPKPFGVRYEIEQEFGDGSALPRPPPVSPLLMSPMPIHGTGNFAASQSTTASTIIHHHQRSVSRTSSLVLQNPPQKVRINNKQPMLRSSQHRPSSHPPTEMDEPLLESGSGHGLEEL